jgi:hypothetical protein
MAALLRNSVAALVPTPEPRCRSVPPGSFSAAQGQADNFFLRYQLFAAVNRKA